MTGDDPLDGLPKFIHFGQYATFWGDDCPTEILSGKNPVTPDVWLIDDYRGIEKHSEHQTKNTGPLEHYVSLHKVDNLLGD